MWDMLANDLRPEIFLRLALTLLAGFVLGVERERHGRAAGLRTTLLVSLSACLAMIVSEHFYYESIQRAPTASWHPDPARLAAGVLTGMGFLGAGVIIRQSNFVIRGVTTAATLWFATMVGISFGAGAEGMGIACSVAAFVILFFLPKIEKHIKDDWYSDLAVQLDAATASVEAIVSALKEFGLGVKSVEIEADHQQGRRRIVFHLRYKKGDQLRLPLQVTDRVGQLPGVQTTHWRA